jgi:hypothetical protein
MPARERRMSAAGPLAEVSPPWFRWNQFAMHTGGATRAPSGSSCGAVAVRQELRGELLTGEACRQAARRRRVAVCVRAG